MARNEGKERMLPDAKLDALLTRHAAIEGELARRLAPEIYVKLSRELAELAPVVDKVKAHRAVVAELKDLDALIEDAATEAEMRAIATSEKSGLGGRRRPPGKGSPPAVSAT